MFQFIIDLSNQVVDVVNIKFIVFDSLAILNKLIVKNKSKRCFVYNNKHRTIFKK